MPEEPVTDRQIMQAISAMIQWRDFYYELMDHADEITARVNRDTEMPEELKKQLGEQP